MSDIIEHLEEYYFVICDEEDYIEKGNGNGAVPKLYQLGQAKSLATRRNKDSLDAHNRYGHDIQHYIVVPANLPPIDKRKKL